MRIAARRALVTGATGFIGGRLVEALARDHGVPVRALVRNLSRAARIARFDVELQVGSLEDEEALREAVRGCDVVFHCAVSVEGTPDQVRASIAGGAVRLARAALEAGALVVHLSSYVVYDQSFSPLDETAPRRPCGWPYADGKLDAEQLLHRLHREEGLRVVVLQPTIVYGPFGGWWTAGQLDLLRRGPLGLVDGGAGLCHAVYVDDVVQAMLLAAADDAPVGETFLVSAAAPVRWSEYYGAFERMLGARALVAVTAEQVAARRAPPQGARTEERGAWWSRLLGRKRPAPVAAAQTGAGAPVHLPDPVLLPYLTSRSEVRIEKARRVLGYRPTFGLDEGMRLTERWARWAGLL